MHKVNEVVDGLVSKSQERPPTPLPHPLQVANPEFMYKPNKDFSMPQSMLNLFMGYLHLKLIISRKTPSSSNFIQCDWCQGPNLVFFEIQMSDIAFLGGGRQREGRRAHISGVSNDFP